ncbi:sigma 54-interacting transcriptional regulator [Pendulispora albinea]|uniref:Sigma 54-interacting transcriptional regulator n=1 Tax=Pendulispora albinea TaxID=2741071 RepID=A0ABZ2M9Q2_9BACT
MSGGGPLNKHMTGVSSSYHGEGAPERAAGETTGTTHPGLVLLYAPNFEQFHPAYVFTVPELIIGRDATNPICVPEQAVSRQHARISYLDGRWILSDLGSRNGTMVGGRFVGEHALGHLDEIRVGDAIFKFVAGGAEHYVRHRIDGAIFGERRAHHLAELVGGCQMDFIAGDVERIAPTELSCMVLGETGTGKEVVARGIHRLSGRRGSFQAINCAAIPHNLLESELFGYRRGAFSGADRDKPGLVKLADGGTLFLDEIGDMPLEAQAKLLRVLQMREVFPLGGTTADKVDIRVVCATHRDLYTLVRDGRFRGDLFARLNEHAVRLPPLRERKEDVLLLARSFATRYGAPRLSFTFSVLVALMHYNWPFNVRELESCIKRGIALCGGSVLDAPQLPDAIAEFMKGYGARTSIDSLGPLSHGGPPPPFSSQPISQALPSRRGAPTEDELRELLTRHRGNIAAVGRELGKERMQVHRWLKKYNIDHEKYR